MQASAPTGSGGGAGGSTNNNNSSGGSTSHSSNNNNSSSSSSSANSSSSLKQQQRKRDRETAADCEQRGLRHDAFVQYQQTLSVLHQLLAPDKKTHGGDVTSAGHTIERLKRQKQEVQRENDELQSDLQALIQPTRKRTAAMK